MIKDCRHKYFLRNKLRHLKCETERKNKCFKLCLKQKPENLSINYLCKYTTNIIGIGHSNNFLIANNLSNLKFLTKKINNHFKNFVTNQKQSQPIN